MVYTVRHCLVRDVQLVRFKGTRHGERAAFIFRVGFSGDGNGDDNGNGNGSPCFVVRNVVGKSALEREDLEPILEKLKTNFMNKNVAEDIAERLCESGWDRLLITRIRST